MVDSLRRLRSTFRPQQRSWHFGLPSALPGALIGLLVCALPFAAPTGQAQSDVVKFANGLGGLPTDTLRQSVRFGASAAGIGDVNGDGVPEVAVGAPGEQVAESDPRGDIYLLFLNGASSTEPGTVNSFLTITDGVGGLSSGDAWRRCTTAECTPSRPKRCAEAGLGRRPACDLVRVQGETFHATKRLRLVC